jgi:hypothetical protein
MLTGGFEDKAELFPDSIRGLSENVILEGIRMCRTYVPLRKRKTILKIKVKILANGFARAPSSLV